MVNQKFGYRVPGTRCAGDNRASPSEVWITQTNVSVPMVSLG
ncbi:hypothetical protein [Leptothermofonsia sichuanensis]|nr:hypothetical protein [Leptothermofonsia sichuanensis]